MVGGNQDRIRIWYNRELMAECVFVLYENELLYIVEDGGELIKVVDLAIFSVDVENAIVVIDLVQV